MELTELIKRARELTKPFRIADGKNFRLTDIDRDDTLGYGYPKVGKEKLQQLAEAKRTWLTSK